LPIAVADLKDGVSNWFSLVGVAFDNKRAFIWRPHTMDADDLKKRTKLFALRVLKLAAALPSTIEGRAIRG
jgi:hypothetical protein